MAEYDTRPGVSPDRELFERLKRIEHRLDTLQGPIERGDNWQGWINVATLVQFTSTAFTQGFFSYGGYWGQDVLIIEMVIARTVGAGSHTLRITTGDGVHTFTDAARTSPAQALHRFTWLHPYQTHPEDYRFRPGSTTLLRLAPPPHIDMQVAVASGSTWWGWPPQSRASSAEVHTTAVTGGTFAWL